MQASHWLQFLAAFLIVVGVLSIALGISEWWRWRRGR